MKKTFSAVISILLALVTVFSCFTVFADDDDDYYEEAEKPKRVVAMAVSQISETSIKLTWNGSAYSDAGYQVYLCNASKKPVKLIKDVKVYGYESDYSCNIYNLKKGSKYNFSVRAYTLDSNKKKYYASYSPVLTASTSPGESKITYLKYASKGKVKIRWKKSSSASGYFIEYSTNNKFVRDGYTCFLPVGKDKSGVTLSGLAKKKYYFRVVPFIKCNNLYYCALPSPVKTLKLKAGASVKSALNSMKSTTKYKKDIKKLTDGKVDISKYKTTYERVKALYDWHSKNNTKHGWSCLECNGNFCMCMSYLFTGCSKSYDDFIDLEAGYFQNSNGARPIHKWSVIYIGAVPYVFDPRLQGYTSNKTGTTYFGVPRKSKMGKRFVLTDGVYMTLSTDPYMYDYFNGYYQNYGYTDEKACESVPFINPISRPASVKVKAASSKSKINLSWNKSKSSSGYQIEYSTNKKMSSPKYININSGNTTKQTLSNLKKNKTYYIRIRPYRNVGNSKIYGFWSGVVAAKAK